ncbi:disease resistance family protein / LRR family protein [Euphorbia peplus]|nr:disease resistance family protein / LRR family protein [Euphorbia peplus]
MAINRTPSAHVLILLSNIYAFLLSVLLAAAQSASTNSSCIEIERNALVQFKQSLVDPSRRLSSWVGEDCCQWDGVTCSKVTGNVTRIDLRNSFDLTYPEYIMFGSEAEAYEWLSLSGQISPSLLNLKHLQYLDLSKNNFLGNPIPEFIGSLSELKYLNLSHASFSGMIPPHLGNLSNLENLDLFPYSFTNPDPKSLWVSNLNWVARLESLRYLNLANVNLSLASNHWLQTVNMLPSLLELRLTGCDLRSLPHSLPSVNITKLQVLDLTVNSFNSSLIPSWLFNLTALVTLNLANSEMKDTIVADAWRNFCNLQVLDLSFNEISGDVLGSLPKCSNTTLEVLSLRYSKFSGNIPELLGNFKRLRVLKLCGNSFVGSIPKSIERLSFLEELDLSNNRLSGNIPESIGQISALNYLDLSMNSWQGVVSENHFLTLKHLKCLSLSSVNQSLAFSVKQEWVPPFSLEVILIKDCRLSSTFPAWLKTQKELVRIALKGVSISGTIPGWFWNLTPNIRWLELQNNQLTGILPKSLNFSPEAVYFDISSNLFKGTVPLSLNVQCLSFSNNKFSNPIPQTMGQEMSSAFVLQLSGNLLSGNIPSSLNKMKKLTTLDLSNNRFSGNVFGDWKGLEELNTLDLSNNNLSGGIPNSICSLPQLQILKLNGNSLSGDFSLSLQNCTSLVTLDLGGNKFSGKIPNWIGERLVSVSLLNLQDNMFSGSIPEQLCHLSSLHILNLSHNNLSGSIPPCLGSLSGITSFKPYSASPYAPPYSEQTLLNVKGQQIEYTKILYLVNIIDLSRNNLQGEIPDEITNLKYLGTLNVSQNQLTGKIPENIGDLKRLETLDLSCNHISGVMPPSMPSMTSLNYLNLSHNNLSGRIPSTNQFLTLIDPSIYEDNPGLCGPPLPTNCSVSNEGNKQHKDDDREEEDESGTIWFCLGMAVGFVVGFWAVCGSLIVKRSWRNAYFKFVDRMKDRAYVIIVLNMARVRRKLNWEKSY